MGVRKCIHADGFRTYRAAAASAGLRVLGANVGNSPHASLTQHAGQLTPDFAVHRLDMGAAWTKVVNLDRLDLA